MERPPAPRTRPSSRAMPQSRPTADADLPPSDRPRPDGFVNEDMQDYNGPTATDEISFITSGDIDQIADTTDKIESGATGGAVSQQWTQQEGRPVKRPASHGSRFAQQGEITV